MQKSTKTKEIPRMQRRIFFGAIMLALLVHGLLLVLFEYAPSEKTYRSTHTAGVTFMNLASQTPEKRREILNWLEYHEPSLISVPNAKYGYNQLTPNIDFRPAQPDKVHKADLPEVPTKKPKEFSSLKMHNKAENILLRNLIFKHPHKIMSGNSQAGSSGYKISFNQKRQYSFRIIFFVIFAERLREAES